MKKVLSILLATFLLTISLTSMVMAADLGFTFEANVEEVNVGDVVIVTLTNDSALTVSAGGFYDFTFNDNFELLECDDQEENYTEIGVPKTADMAKVNLDSSNGKVGDTSFAYSANKSIKAGKIVATYVLKATKAGAVKITCTPKMKAYDSGVEDYLADTLTVEPVTVTVKGAEPTTYTVTYNAGEGSNAPAADTNVAADTVIDLTKKAEPTAPSGKQFKGWSANGTDIITSLTVTGNVTLTALYEEIPATSLLEGIYTRLAKNVTIDYTNKTINLVYDTAQRVFQSSYVAFAPKAADGVTVKYSSKDAFISDHARLTNYTETASSATNIDLAAEKATSKSAIVGNAIQNAQGTFNFTMTLENVSGEATENYQVTVQLTDTSAEVVGLVANSGITATDFKTFRESDEVAINTSTKVITLTTKNMYNYTTIAIDATKIGENAIATNAARPHRAMELVNADDNARYMDFANVELANQYSSAVLVNYVNGETRSYPVRIYGGSDGTSYEDYTLTVVYAPTTNINAIKIGRIHNLANAIGNSVAEINETGKIQITYDPAKSEISFSPVYARGYNPTISGGEGKVTTEQQTIAGALRDVYTITTANIPSALKYNVRRIRDTRVYDFEFLTK